jgi:hypothetical protein
MTTKLVDFTKNAPPKKVNLLVKDLSVEDALQLVAEKAGDSADVPSVCRTLVHEIERLTDVVLERNEDIIKLVDGLNKANTPKYLMVGYGETDFPDYYHATTLEEVRKGFHMLVYGGFEDEDTIRDEGLVELMEDFENPTKWSHDGIWNTTFEIGGITVYKLYDQVNPAYNR